MAVAGAGTAASEVARFFAEAGGGEETAFQINLFWIIAQAASFLLLLVILYLVAFRRVGAVLETRRSMIEQGLKDAEGARQEREAAAAERRSVLDEARRESADIVARAQRVAEEERERGVQATREEIERMREQAVADIDTERQRALAEVRAQVADLALLAAGRVVGETMTAERERKLVQQFLSEVTAEGTADRSRN